MIRVVSTFSGIEGIGFGLARAGLPEPEVLCESDEYARAVLAKRFPGVPIYEDIERFPPYLAEDALLVGGFPCQDISGAGKGKGLAGARSGLWFAFEEVLWAARPPLVVVENVASAGNRWVDQVRARLDELGYAVLPLKLSAEDVGAPHLRRRWFLLGLRRDAVMATGVPASSHWLAHDILTALGGGLQMSIDERYKPVQQIIDERLLGVAYDSRAMGKFQRAAMRGAKRLARRESELYPTPTACRYGSSNNGDPHDGRDGYATAGKPSLWEMVKRPRTADEGTRWRTPLRRDAKGRDPGRGTLYDQIPRTAAAGTRWSTAVVTDAKASGRKTTVGKRGNTMKPGLSMTDGLRLHRGEELFLNPGFVEALMGFPVGWTDLSDDMPTLQPFPPVPADDRGWDEYIAMGGPVPGVPEGEQGEHSSERLRACGNAVVPDVAEVVGAVVLAVMGAK